MENKNLEEALKKFKDNGISHGTNRLNEVLKYQDIIGRMSFNEISKNYNTMDKPEKGTFLWVSCTCLDKDTFLEITKRVVCQNIITEHDEYIEKEYSERFNAIVDRENNMTNLEKENAVNIERIKYLELQLQQAKRNMLDITGKAVKFDQIRELLK